MRGDRLIQCVTNICSLIGKNSNPDSHAVLGVGMVAGIVGLNPAENMDIRLLSLLYVLQVAASVTSWPLV
jgi:hypothetical protein